MLGNSVSGNYGTTNFLKNINYSGTLYSLIEIGNETIRKVGVYDTLDNYLHRALDHSGEVELEISKDTIGDHLARFLKLLAMWIAVALALMFFIPNEKAALLIVILFWCPAGLGLLMFFLHACDHGSIARVISITIDGKKFTD